MAPPFDETRYQHIADGGGRVERIPPALQAKEPKQDRAVAGGDDSISQLRHSHESVPPVIVSNIDTMNTQVDLPAVRAWPFNTSMVSGLSIDEESTWLIPVVSPPPWEE